MFSHKKIIGAALVCLTAISSADASVLFTLNNGNSYDVEYVVGTGSNTSILEIAFSDSQYVLFGYRWDSSTTQYASNMISAVDTAVTDSQTGSTITTSLSVDGTDYGWGVFYSAFTYGSLSGVSDWDNDGTWWGYLNSADGITWVSPDYGASAGALVDNGFQAMAFGTSPTAVSVQPVPESASLGLLIIGLLMQYRKR